MKIGYFLCNIGTKCAKIEIGLTSVCLHTVFCQAFIRILEDKMEGKNGNKFFLKYVTLNVLGMIGLSCYILADTFFIARSIGADGLTALNIAIPIYSFIHGAGLMVGMGGATRYSISKSKTIFTQSLYLVFILSSVFLTIGLFLPNQLATLLGADMVTHHMISVYLRVILCFAPAFMLNNLMICFVRNDGNPRLSMVAMLLGSFSNIILDYVFLFIFQLGMLGAAVATGIAPVVSLMILSSHRGNSKLGFHLHKSKPLLSAFTDISLLGVSSLITELSSGIVIIVFNIIILRLLGNLGVAAYGIIANISLVIIAIFTGISQGIQPIISQCYGERKYAPMKRILRLGIVVAVMFGIIVYVVSCIYAESMVSVFNKEKDLQLLKIAKDGFYLYFISFLFTGFNFVLATYFGSIDQPKYSFLISILRGFLLIIPFTVILSILFGMTGVWIAMPLTELIVLAIFFKKGFNHIH